MSSTSQINDAATMSEDQLTKMLSQVKSSRETEELRARLPAQLAPFASNIRVIEPVQNVCISSGYDGIYGCYCSIDERRIRFSVTVAPASSHSQSKKPNAKPLTLVWRDCQTSSPYVSGLADSRMRSISLQYGRPRRGEPEAKAFTGWYNDPQIAVSGFTHGGVKSVVEKVVRDMGLHENEFGNELEVIDALLGDDGKQLLETEVGGHVEEGETLKEILQDQLVKEESNDW